MGEAMAPFSALAHLLNGALLMPALYLLLNADSR